MALDFRTAVNKTIVDLRREISKKSSEVATLRKELARYETVSYTHLTLPTNREV